MLKKAAFLFLTVMLLCTLTFAQSGTTGALNGQVTDPEGSPLPGVTVTITSPSMVVKEMVTLTNENGKYRFNALNPGVYVITFSLEGMNTLKRSNIKVLVSKTFTVNQKMELKSISESVEVKGKAPTIDRQSTTGANNMEKEFLDSIPAGRNLGSYFNMTPGVTSDAAHGSAEHENSYNIDGVNISDPATNTQGASFGMDIMEEISVQAGGISAEYGNAKGAVINVVTKSGGNNFSGSAYFNYDHENLRGDNTEGTKVQGVSGAKFRHEPGITLGGPIVKDRLWFFGSFSMIKSETMVAGYPADSDVDIPADSKRVYPYLKLSLSPSQKDKFVVSYSYNNSKRNHKRATPDTTESATQIQDAPVHIFNFHWTHFFGNNLFANFKFAYMNQKLILDAKGDQGNLIDTFTGIAGGNYWRAEDHNTRPRYQFVGNATTFIEDFMGSHELKFGIEAQHSPNKWDTVGAENDHNGLSYIFTNNGTPYFGYKMIGYNQKQTISAISAFIQDTWNISSNLTLNIGVRFDNQKIKFPAQNQDETDWDFGGGLVFNRRQMEDLTALDWTTVSPRLGMIYDMFKDGSTLIKATYARYTQPTLADLVGTTSKNTWIAYGQAIRPDWSLIPGTISPLWIPGTTMIGYKERDIDAPITDEITIGIDRELFEDWSASVRYIKKWDRDLVHKVDANALDIDALLDRGEFIWTNFEPVTVTDPFNNQQITFWSKIDTSIASADYIVNPPGASRDYDSVEFTLSKRYSHGWQINASYVWQNSRGLITTARGNASLGGGGTMDLYCDPNSHTNSEGRFPFERRHQFKLQGLVKGPLGINLGCYFRYMSGQRYTRQVSDQYLGVKTGQDAIVSINAEKKGSRGLPAFYQLDLRLEKEFRVNKFKLRVFADMFNVFNSSIVDDLYTDSTHPTKPFEQEVSLIAPRTVRLGVKIEFN